MGIEDEKYVRFTTFKRDGTPVSTATWIVPLDGGRMGFWTASTTGKVKRLAHTARVEVQPSDNRGRAKPGTDAIGATAQVVSDGDDFAAVKRRIVAKYGAMTTLTRFLARIGAFVRRRPFVYADRVVVITPN
ncbi:PPOX class F420-dependent oxidoreductase [Desertimonas flava]|uniref:PPOX class F420-dependent oxidoreductase n=1 Tax=Desertimonas flava TaxID=2064846 RepID=UPI000E34579A|nr:PPOX class F420-dependent oxidoreductase [Desertimonas flava]